MTKIYEVYYQSPTDIIENWRKETEVYGGHRYTKGAFLDQTLASRVATYYSKKENKTYRIHCTEILDEKDVLDRIKVEITQEIAKV